LLQSETTIIVPLIFGYSAFNSNVEIINFCVTLEETTKLGFHTVLSLAAADKMIKNEPRSTSNLSHSLKNTKA